MSKRGCPNRLGAAGRWLGLMALAAALVLPALPAQAAIVELAAGVSAGIGVAVDNVHNHLYYVEFNGGTLKRLRLTPDCEADPPVSPCVIDTVTAGFSHPEDVTVNAAAGIGYVTTRDDPGTTGALWRVDLATGIRSLVTFNLGAPQQIVLDPPTNTAYVVGYDNGKLWRIDLTTGVKVPVITGLGHPVGLAINADRTRGYVTEQDTSKVVEIDMARGTRIRDVATGLTSAFFLAWTDPAQISLYVAERGPANEISRIDLVTATTLSVIPSLPPAPSGIAVNHAAGAVYLTTDTKVLRVGLGTLPPTEPVFLGVGHVPSSSISAAGYATTAPGYFFQVKHSPFGGTMNIFGNLASFKELGASHYRVLVSKDSGPYTALGHSWTAYRWSSGTFEYDPVTVAPVTADKRYEIPPEYPGAPQRWYPPFLMMRWPSTNNGVYNFRVEIFGSAATPTAIPLPAGNSLTLKVDNTPPQVDLVAIRQRELPGIIQPCDIVSSGTDVFEFQITAFDPNQHLLSYSLTAYWGKNKAEPFVSDSYASHVAPAPPHPWNGVTNTWLPVAGWEAKCNCAHTFILRAWKRTIDGYNYTLRRDSHQSITINNNAGPNLCQ